MFSGLAPLFRTHDTWRVQNRQSQTARPLRTGSLKRSCHPETNRSAALIGDSDLVGKDQSPARIAAASVRICFFLWALFLLSSPLSAQRKPVLPQIDLPHPYYYRELYLPQLTSGPSSVSWAPDSKEIVYSMAGSLWRQKLDSEVAVQLTDGAGYDYQPDWSPDGKTIIYVSYQKDAMELWLLDVASGKTAQLTSGGAVNVEPRWSPDGKRMVFVSTQFNKRFHIFRADVRDGKLENLVRLTGETKSDLPRYYYSQYDTEINPVWTRDGQEILFISNQGHIHGTGGFWRMKAEPGTTAREIHYEETSWKARPDFSPDGSRMVYSSYLGGQWHNLWLMPANGADAFPVSYGDFDHTNVRWSPDGTKIAFISNSSDDDRGNLQLAFQTFPGGAKQEIHIASRRYLRPHAQLDVQVLDEQGSSTLARISVTDAAGRFCAPIGNWIHADDAFDRSQRPFEAHYFYNRFRDADHGDLEVPMGKLTIEISRGPRYVPETREVLVTKTGVPSQTIRLRLVGAIDDRSGHWMSSDLHVHGNYGGTYKNDRYALVDQAEGEDVDIANNLVVNKEQRFPDIALFEQPNSLRDPDHQIVRGQEFHTSYWGHRGILHLKDHLLLPGYAGASTDRGRARGLYFSIRSEPALDR